MLCHIILNVLLAGAHHGAEGARARGQAPELQVPEQVQRPLPKALPIVIILILINIIILMMLIIILIW